MVPPVAPPSAVASLESCGGAARFTSLHGHVTNRPPWSMDQRTNRGPTAQPALDGRHERKPDGLVRPLCVWFAGEAVTETGQMSETVE